MEILKNVLKKYCRKHFQKNTVIPSCFQRTNIIFVHVPKCAGSSVCLHLFGYRVGHITIDKYWHANPAFVRNAFKFSFVRHPYLRIWSAYNFLIKGGLSKHDKALAQKHKKALHSFCTFVEALRLSDELRNILIFRPQYQFLSIPSNEKYKIFMDFVGKTEWLSEDLRHIRKLLPEQLVMRLERVASKPLNVTKSNAIILEKEAIACVREIYDIDYELFGYDEWETKSSIEALIKERLR